MLFPNIPSAALTSSLLSVRKLQFWRLLPTQQSLCHLPLLIFCLALVALTYCFLRGVKWMFNSLCPGPGNQPAPSLEMHCCFCDYSRVPPAISKFTCLPQPNHSVLTIYGLCDDRHKSRHIYGATMERQGFVSPVEKREEQHAPSFPGCHWS